MVEATIQWSEDQVVEAFNQFRNSNAAESAEEAERQLRGHLNDIGEGPFEADDILTVSQKMVPFHCAGQMAAVIVGWLSENTSPPTIH